MVLHIYKQRRTRDGKVEVSRLYRGRFKLQGESAVTDVPLGTSDKQVALKKLNELVAEREREKAGLIAPRLQRESAQKPMMDHLSDFIADLTVLGRCNVYRKHIRVRVERVLKSEHWRYPADVSIDGFVKWRCRQRDIGPKTLNEYLNAFNALLNWMERQGRIADNPLRKATRVDTRGKSQRRRAFTDDELERLLAVAGRRRELYLVAAYTGLRAGELQQLVWSDVQLDCGHPHIIVRAITAKNRREAFLPLHPLLAAELRAFQKRASHSGPADAVFPGCKQTARTMRHHILKAGVAPIDESGRKLDFHALRYTFATKLFKSGVSPRVAQELMRHSDPRLTANVYTDVTQLPGFSAVSSMQWHSGRSGSGNPHAVGTAIASHSLAAGGQVRAFPDIQSGTLDFPKNTDSERRGRLLAPLDAKIQNAGREGLERQQGAAVNPHEKPNESRPNSSGTAIASHTAVLCPDLVKVVANWPSLPDSIQRAILELANYRGPTS